MTDSKLVAVNAANVEAFIAQGHVVLDFFGKS